MLKIHKLFSKQKLFIILITSICGIGTLLGLQILTYAPELSHAEMVTSKGLSGITYMQEMTADVCSNTNENESKQLIDSRDGKTYWVTKLADDNCWMTQNLALDLNISRPLTPTDSDVSRKWTPSTNTQTGVPSSFTTANIDLDQSYYPGEYVYTNPTTQLTEGCGLLDSIACKDGGWTKRVGLSTDTSGDIEAHYLVGGYYSWAAATTSGNVDDLADGEIITDSICPKGWKMPSSKESNNTKSGSYYFLFDKYGVSSNVSSATGNYDLRSAPLYYMYGGGVYGSSIVAAGFGGFYWTSTYRLKTTAYALRFNIAVNPSSNYDRYAGYSVRCVARTEPEKMLSDLTYMQEMTAEVCKNSDINETKQLIDRRDGKSYWVAKLKDNNCWMTQNLDLDIPAEGLKAEDTDILEDWNVTTNPTYPPVKTQTGSPSGFYNPSNAAQNAVLSYDPGVMICEKGKEVCSAPIGADYDKHYLQGNYYTFNAATAGKGVSLTTYNDSVEDSSICPKNWQLPLSGSVNNKVNMSFYNLLDLYGLSSKLSGVEVGGVTYGIDSNPLYFVYSGVTVSGDSLGSVGEGGYYRSSTAAGAASAYLLNFSSTYSVVRPVYMSYRLSGMSVRCVAEGEEKISGDNVKITINPTISLEVASEVEVTKSETNPATTDLNVKAASNQPYVVKISAEEMELKSDVADATIPAKSGLLNTAENGWGIRKVGASEYTAVTDTPELFYQAANPEVKEFLLKVGISTAADLPAGEYFTNLLITATQN